MPPKNATKDITNPVDRRKAPEEDTKREPNKEGAYSLVTFHDAFAQEIGGLAEQATVKFAQWSKTENRLEHDVHALFMRFARRKPAKTSQLEGLLTAAPTVSKTIQLDQKLALSLLAAQGEFDKARINCDGKFKSATTSWELALRQYEAAARSNAATLFAAINVVTSSVPEVLADDASAPPDGSVEVPSSAEAPASVEVPVTNPCAALLQYHNHANGVAVALDKYEQDMSMPTRSVVTALGTLTSQLAEVWTLVTQAEAALIKAEQRAAVEYWREAARLLTPAGTSR